MKRNQRIWMLLVLVYVANTSAVLGGICTQIFDPGISLIFLAGAEAGILTALILARSLRGDQPGA
jgi:hypothetical protein